MVLIEFALAGRLRRNARSNRKMGVLYTQGEVEALHDVAAAVGSKVKLEPMV